QALRGSGNSRRSDRGHGVALDAMAVPGTRSAGADDGGIGLLGFDHDVGFDARVIPVAVTPRSASRRAQQAGKRSAARLGAVHLQSNTRADSVVCQAASVCSVGSTSTIKDRPRYRIVVDPARLKALGTSVVASEVAEIFGEFRHQ